MAKRKSDPAVDAWVKMLRSNGVTHYGQAPGASSPSLPTGGGKPAASPWGNFAESLKVSDDEAKKILGKQGLKITDLDKDTQKAFRTANRADAQAILLGAKRKKGQSWWQRGLDIISRPLYGSAAAVEEGLDKNVSGGGLGDTLAATGKGWWHGITGKHKATFSDVIQHSADLHHAAERGVDQKHILTDTKEREAKVNPWLKYGAGLAADVALDPTTYAGVGLISKGARGKEAIKTLEESGRLVKAAKGTEHAGKIHEVLQSHLAPVENLSKKKIAALSPEARQVAEKALEYQKEIGRKGRKNLRKAQGDATGFRGTTLETGKTVGQTLDELEKVKALRGISHVAAANAAPKVTKQLAVRFGRSQVAVPGVAAPFTKASRALAQTKPVEYFNNLFRAKAGIGNSLHAVRNAKTGGLGQALVHYGKNLQEVYGKVPVGVRKGLLDSWRKDATQGSKVTGGLDLYRGTKETPLMQHFDEEVKALAERVDNLQALPEDLNSLLPGGYRANPLRREGVTKKGKPAYSTKEREGWLLHHIKTADAKNMSDPAKVLHFFNAAISHLEAKKSMEEAISHGFGTPASSKAARGLKAQGYRTVKGLGHNASHMDDVLFHPDVAHGIERMHQVFKSRQATDGFLRAVEKSTTSVKSLMTIYNPGFHPRTMVGEVLLNYLSGMMPHQIVWSYKKAAQVMHGRDRELLGGARTELALKTQKVKDQVKTLLEQGKTKEAWDASEGTIVQHADDVDNLTDYATSYFPDAPTNGIVHKTVNNPLSGEPYIVSMKFKNGVPVGVISSGFNPKHSDDLLRLVHPDYRGQGINGELNAAHVRQGADMTTYLLNDIEKGQMHFSKDAAEALTRNPGLELSREQTRTANILHGGTESRIGADEAARNGAQGIVKTKYGMLSADQLWHAYLNSGVKSGYASADLVRAGSEAGKAPRTLGKVNKGVHKTSEFVEDTGRLAQFIFEVSKSKARTLDEAFQEAAQRVMKYHLDYSAVTKTEQGISNYAIPFYKWLRLSTPLMVDVLLHQPGKVLQVPKTLSAISKGLGYDEGEGQGLFPSEPDVMVPSFLREHGAYPMFGGNTHYYDPTSLFPVAGSLDLLNGGVLDKLNPLITYPLEGAAKLDPESKVGQAIATKQSWPAFLSSIVPQTKFAYNEIAQPDPNINGLERLMMFLGNPGFVSNTPQKVKSEIYKERSAATKNRKKRKQELGIPLR